MATTVSLVIQYGTEYVPEVIETFVRDHFSWDKYESRDGILRAFRNETPEDTFLPFLRKLAPLLKDAEKADALEAYSSGEVLGFDMTSGKVVHENLGA